MGKLAIQEAAAQLKAVLKEAEQGFPAREVRFIVDTYYQIQKLRVALAAQSRSQAEGQESLVLHSWLTDQMAYLEKQIQRAMDKHTLSFPVGAVVRSAVGIGPVTAAGLFAHIDIRKAPYAGNIWAYAGLSPGVEWKKGEKRPWNAALKRLCYNIGMVFVKFSSNEKCEYGRLYALKRAQEIAANERGEFAAQAAAQLKAKKYGKSTVAYQAYTQGKLPPDHINSRARRFAVKIYLSDFHAVCYMFEHDVEPPTPYVVAHDDGHNRVWRAAWVPTLSQVRQIKSLWSNGHILEVRSILSDAGLVSARALPLPLKG